MYECPCVRLLCLCCSVCRQRSLRWADPPSKESYYLYKKDYETKEEARAQQRAVETLMNEWNELIFSCLPSTMQQYQGLNFFLKFVTTLHVNIVNMKTRIALARKAQKFPRISTRLMIAE
jgi:predicted adenine nucleotide alpha hydrolase (AANH) superfamily ATPase